MSKAAYQTTDDRSGVPEDDSNAPTGQVSDDSYATGKTEAVPVVGDDAHVEDPIQADGADTDQALERDDKEAIDPSNTVKERLRGNKPKPGALKEPEMPDSELGLE